MPSSQGVPPPPGSRVTSHRPAELDAARPVLDECFAADPSSVTRARRATRLAVAGHSSADDVESVVAELSANAVQHARTPFRLRVHEQPGSVLVRVDDEEPQGTRLVAEALQAATSPVAGHGRGLALVAALADRWGVAAEGTGTCVWAVVGTTPEPQQTGGSVRP